MDPVRHIHIHIHIPRHRHRHMHMPHTALSRSRSLLWRNRICPKKWSRRALRHSRIAPAWTSIRPSIPTCYHHGAIRARPANTLCPHSRSPRASPPVRCAVYPSAAARAPAHRPRRQHSWPHSHRRRLHPAVGIQLSPSRRCPPHSLDALAANLSPPIPRAMGK